MRFEKNLFDFFIRFYFIFFFLLSVNTVTKSQRKDESKLENDKPKFTFGKVSANDFNLSQFKVDTSAGAIIIADLGKSWFEGNQKGGFTLEFTHTRRIKIFNKKGYDLANVEIPIYFDNTGNSETIHGLKASTYLLNQGKIMEFKLGKEAIFTDRKDKNHSIQKFTLPNVQDGCILEYNYTIKSDFIFNLQPWVFQETYPRIWSEYLVDIPSFFYYVIITQGYNPFLINSTSSYGRDYTVTFNGGANFSHPNATTLQSSNIIHRWAMKNVPSLKPENFTSTINNHISKIEFQLSGQQFPNSTYKNIMGNWNTLAEHLLENERFGYFIKTNNNWMDPTLKRIELSSKNKLETAKKIFKFVRDSIKSIGNQGVQTSQSFKECYRSKSGTVADMNLMLTAMLSHEKLNANPVILSIRGSSYINSIYPQLERFNYVISLLVIDSTFYLLDTSKPYMGFGKLPSYCYNGEVKVIEKEPETINLSPDNINESSMTNVLLYIDPKSNLGWTGLYKKELGDFESNSLREKFIENGKEKYLKSFRESFPPSTIIDSLQVLNETNYESPVLMYCNLKIENENKANLIYLSPSLINGIKVNPFKSLSRKYPIEMPYKTDELYTFQLEIPTGYIVDEIPKSMKLTLNENEGVFEYYLEISNGFVKLRSRIKFNKATFHPEDYESLRNFYNAIIKKQGEQIVFKKK